MDGSNKEEVTPPKGNTAHLRALLQNKIKPSPPQNGELSISKSDTFDAGASGSQQTDAATLSDASGDPKAGSATSMRPRAKSAPRVPPKPAVGVVRKTTVQTVFPAEKDFSPTSTEVETDFSLTFKPGKRSPPKLPPKPPSKPVKQAKSLDFNDSGGIEDELLEILDEEKGHKKKSSPEKNGPKRPTVLDGVCVGSPSLREELEGQLSKLNPALSPPIVLEPSRRRDDHNISQESLEFDRSRAESNSSADSSDRSVYSTPKSSQLDDSVDDERYHFPDTPVVDGKNFFPGSPITPLPGDADESFTSRASTYSESTYSDSGTMSSEQSAAYSNILRQMGLVVREMKTRQSIRGDTKVGFPMSNAKSPDPDGQTSKLDKTQSVDHGNGPDLLAPDVQSVERLRKKSLPGNLDDIPEGIGSLRETPKRSRGQSPMLESPTRSTPNFLPLPSAGVDSGVFLTSPGSSGDYDIRSRISEVSESGNEEEGADGIGSAKKEEKKLEEDSPEAKRRRKLRKIAEEFADSERNYVKTLDLLCNKFPAYIENAQEVKGETANLTFDIVSQMSKKLSMAIPIHKQLLEEFEFCIANWNEEFLLDARPRYSISSAFVKSADFLKLCATFLRDKVKIVSSLRETQEQNREFSNAVKHFEISCFKGLRLYDQLDCVHARICRYPLLLSSYLKYLPSDSKEYAAAQKAKVSTESVAASLESNLVEGDGTNQLLEIYRKLNSGNFDVFQPGRQLIKIGHLDKQSRKEIQQRVLILFSDCILYCHPSGDTLNVRRTIWLDEKTQVKTQEHEDYKNEFIIISKARSVVMVAKNQMEKKEWVNSISEALKAAVKNRRRYEELRKKGENPQGKIQKKQAKEKTATSNELSPTEPNSPMRQEDIGRVAPVWIADKQATMCQICAKTFTLILRKHHCRGCGKIICQTCSGSAPIEYNEFKVEKVCHACYSVIATRERRDPEKHGGATELEKILVPPLTFVRGTEDHAEEEKTRRSGCVVDGYILKKEKKAWKKYWGVLEDAGALQFYNAPKDTKCHDVFMVVGCQFHELETELDYSIFELRSQNQFQHAGSVERVCTLKTESNRSSQKWITSLQTLLEEFS